MPEDFQEYKPSSRFTDAMTLLNNHFRFVLVDLPDLSFFVQSVVLPDITSGVAKRPTPFTTIPEVGDHLEYNSLNVSYLVDNRFKSYFSLFYWLKGYGFPQSYDDIVNFNASRSARLGNPRPTLREMQKTTATLQIMQPDTDTPTVEIVFTDVFPVALGQLTFETTASEPPALTTNVQFVYTDFDVRLTNPTA